MVRSVTSGKISNYLLTFFQFIDESAVLCGGVYQCEYNTQLDIEVLVNGTANLTVEEAEQLIDIAEQIESVIDIQNGVVQLSLFFVNVITALFIIVGLYKYEENIGFEETNIKKLFSLQDFRITI